MSDTPTIHDEIIMWAITKALPLTIASNMARETNSQAKRAFAHILTYTLRIVTKPITHAVISKYTQHCINILDKITAESRTETYWNLHDVWIMVAGTHVRTSDHLRRSRPGQCALITCNSSVIVSYRTLVAFLIDWHKRDRLSSTLDVIAALPTKTRMWIITMLWDELASQGASGAEMFAAEEKTRLEFFQMAVDTVKKQLDKQK